MPDPSKPYNYENEWMLSEEQKEQYWERDRKWSTSMICRPGSVAWSCVT